MARITLPTNLRATEALLAEQQSAHFLLTLFWTHAEGAKQGKRLEMLRAMGGIRPARQWTKPGKRRQEMRKHFTFKLIDFGPENVCFLCAGPWHHRHHILNVQHGGGNSRSNIVPLCRKCHSLVHSTMI